MTLPRDAETGPHDDSSAIHDVAVSIINFRTGELTINCIRSVLEDRTDLKLCVVVVDNASGDGSAEMVGRWIDESAPDGRVKLVRSTRNTGFSGGHNIGIGAARARNYLLLNSDAILRPGFLDAICAAADDHPACGLVAPRLEAEDGTPQNSLFRFHRPISEFVRGAGSGPVARLFSRYRIALGVDPDPVDIEWASFACILLRVPMLAEVGGMDDGYFLYFEDAEFCLRARRAGWRIHHEPRAVAVHYRGGSGPVKALERDRKRLPRYYYASRTRFFRQANGIFGPVTANLMWYLGRCVAQLRRLVGRPVAPTIDGEARDIWTNILKPLAPTTAPKD